MSIGVRPTNPGEALIDLQDRLARLEMQVGKLGGKRRSSIISAEESTTSSSYTTLATEDKAADIVMPSDGLVVVWFHALWKESVNNTTRAAIFLNEDQVKIGKQANPPDGQAAENVSAGGTTNTYRNLFSTSGGLMASISSAVEGISVSTGQIVGHLAGSADSIFSVGETSLGATETGLRGGPVYIYADAGIYDVSIRYKASSGTVTVKDRRLWCMALGF